MKLLLSLSVLLAFCVSDTYAQTGEQIQRVQSRHVGRRGVYQTDRIPRSNGATNQSDLSDKTRDLNDQTINGRNPVRNSNMEINRTNMNNGAINRTMPVTPVTPVTPGTSVPNPVSTPSGTYSNPTGAGQNSNTGDGTNTR
jgi:hypothetical protein